MRRALAMMLVLAVAQASPAAGLLIPKEKAVPPLAMLNHQVSISINDQVAVTKIEQTFRNHTDRELEATYIFPVPKGASVKEFTMVVNGKVEKGELVEADKARAIYTSIVQRTQDPGLLEYLGNNLFQVKVFPVPPKTQNNGEQKLTITYNSIALAENGLVEYVYPLKTDGKAVSTLEKFTINVDLKSQHAIQNIYSPSHAITLSRPNEREAKIGFEKEQAVLDRDFQLFYTAGSKDVGLTALVHRPTASQNGYFMMLASPRAELSKEQQIPRDMVLVLDTSGSMRGKRMQQARNALKYCLNNLGKNDRFALINFATTVNKYDEKLLPAGKDEVEKARKWVDALEATGGTAIDDALAAALNYRSSDETRVFNIIFFTDGQPTIGETNTNVILANFAKRNTSGTRCFTFGVGDDVNASMLDKLAEDSRAIATYVREADDIELRVSSLFSKISNPVLANLKLTVGSGVSLNEVYPPNLPDLFHGTQLVVLGRFTGDGHAAIKLTGNVGKETREFVYEITFPKKTGDEKEFVEDLWARRKVGYLLDQIRLNGEKKELKDEVITLAKRYGITTPYTSYLIVPDAVVNVIGKRGGEGKPNVRFFAETPDALAPGPGGGPGKKVSELAKELGGGSGGIANSDDAGKARDKINDGRFKGDKKGNKVELLLPAEQKALERLKEEKDANDEARRALMSGLDRLESLQAGKLGVDLSVQTAKLRTQTQMTRTATKHIADRTVLEIGGVWIDGAYNSKMPTQTVKALSKAYFRILERHPSMRNVFRLGNHLVWVTPSNTALIIDLNDGREEMSDADIDRLFEAPPAKK
jgi:Ca-activated chloride channel homolog